MNALCLHCAAVPTHRVLRRYQGRERATHDQILLSPVPGQWKVGSSGTPTSGPAAEMWQRTILSGQAYCLVAWNNKDSWAKKILKILQEQIANFSRFSVKGVGLQPLACWNCVLKSLRVVGGGEEWDYLSFVSVVCRQVEVSAMGWSLVQRNPTECCVCSRHLNNEETHAHWGYQAIKKKEQNSLVSRSLTNAHV